jgi:hypothetical protein
VTLDEDRTEGLRPNAPSFAVAPVTQRSRLPRGIVVAVAIGVLAFVGGIAVASSGPVDRSKLGAGAAPSVPGVPAASGSTSAAGTGGSSSSGGVAADADPGATPAGPDALSPATPAPQPAGSSAFLTAFDPGKILAGIPGGKRCDIGPARQTEVPRTRRDGPRITFQRSWVAWCPVAAAKRQAFLLRVFNELEAQVPADTFGYSASDAGGGDALFPYAQPPLAGTVAVTADEAGTGYTVAIVIEEWRIDTTR